MDLAGKVAVVTGAASGIVTVRTTGRKADGTVFMTFERFALLPMQGHAAEDKMDY